MDTLYLPEATDSYLDTALRTVLQIHAHEPRGDILTFLTGQDEIQALERLIPERSVLCLMLISPLPHHALVSADALHAPTVPGQVRADPGHGSGRSAGRAHLRGAFA